MVHTQAQNSCLPRQRISWQIPELSRACLLRVHELRKNRENSSGFAGKAGKHLAHGIQTLEAQDTQSSKIDTGSSFQPNLASSISVLGNLFSSAWQAFELWNILEHGTQAYFPLFPPNRLSGIVLLWRPKWWYTVEPANKHMGRWTKIDVLIWRCAYTRYDVMNFV